MAGPTIVLVHGAFADASSLRALYDELVGEDATIIAPPNPLRGLSGGDGEYLKGVIKEVVKAAGRKRRGALVRQAPEHPFRTQNTHRGCRSSCPGQDP